MPKIIRITTVPLALKALLRGQMKYMKAAGFDVLMVSADGPERDDVIAFEGCPHIIVPMTRRITPLADLRSLWKLYRLFKYEKPDIVHSHTPKAGLLAMLAARMAGVKIRIHTVAGLRFMTTTGLTYRILTGMEKLTGAAATHVWPNSFSLLNYIKENRLVSEKKLELVGQGSSNGIDLKRFSAGSLDANGIEKAKQLIRYDPHCFYLLAVGRIVKDKGISELAMAFTKAYQHRNDLRLILVGGFEEHLDPLDSETMELIRTHPGIVLAGWQDNVEYFMHLSGLLIHASYREGFPNVILQAGAMECPVICSRIPGNIDIVDDDITGLIFESRQYEELYAKLMIALSDPDKTKRMAKQLRKKIEDNFDRQYVQQQLKKKYESLLVAGAGKQIGK